MPGTPQSRRPSRQVESYRRPLTESEKRTLSGKLGYLRAQGRRASSASTWVGGGIFAALWVATLLASDVPWTIVTAFWLVVGVGITFWVHRDLSREVGHASAMAFGLESALRRGEAEVFHIRAEGFVEFEEVEDEGACYAFDLGGGKVTFLSGQEFYPGPGFPSLDFGLAYILDEEGRSVDMLIQTHGSRANPLRTIPSEWKWKLNIPESLSVVEGSLDDLEELLAS